MSVPETTMATWQVARAALGVHGRLLLDDMATAIQAINDKIEAIGEVSVNTDGDELWSWQSVTVNGTARNRYEIKEANREAIDQVFSDFLDNAEVPTLYAVAMILDRGHDFFSGDK